MGQRKKLRDIRKYFELNENENRTYKNLWSITKLWYYMEENL